MASGTEHVGAATEGAHEYMEGDGRTRAGNGSAYRHRAQIAGQPPQAGQLAKGKPRSVRMAGEDKKQGTGAWKGSMSDERYYTAQEVADRYGLTLQWVYGCRSLPRRKAGKYLRFLESDLIEWEKRQTGTGRVYGFYIFDQPEVRTKLKRSFNYVAHNENYDNGGTFELLFDIQ